MELKEIVDLWDVDCEIDGSQLDMASLIIPRLHHKYYKILMRERIQLKKYEFEKDELTVFFQNYFAGMAVHEDLVKYNLPQHRGVAVLKEQVPTLMNTYSIYQDAVMKVGMQHEKVEYLKEIIKTLNNRHWLIRNAIENRKFEQV